jgi:hypothetical protein
MMHAKVIDVNDTGNKIIVTAQNSKTGETSNVSFDYSTNAGKSAALQFAKEGALRNVA